MGDTPPRIHATGVFVSWRGDVPIIGGRDCDGWDTPGYYRPSTGWVNLRNNLAIGYGDVSFYLGQSGDVPLAGDFNGDRCDTVSLYRPSEGRMFVFNRLGAGDRGLGAADYPYYYGNPIDKPFAGDFDGDGIDTVGLHRESTGQIFLRNSNTSPVLQVYNLATSTPKTPASCEPHITGNVRCLKTTDSTLLRLFPFTMT